jgi:hypothetical protein
MAIVPVNPIVLKDCVVTFAADDYAAALSQAVFTPSASIQTFKGLKAGAVFTDVGAATWSLDISFAQDWNEPDSLSVYLFENEGTTVAATFEPQDGIGDSFTASVVLTPGAIGGSVDSYATATVSLGVVGKPVRVPAV